MTAEQPEMNEALLDQSIIESPNVLHRPLITHDVMTTQEPSEINEIDPDIMELLDQVSGSTHMNRNDGQPFRQMLFLDDIQPNEVQTQYFECFQPAMNNQLFQNPPQTTLETQTDNESQSQSTQTNSQSQPQSTQTLHEITNPSVSSQTDETDMTPALLNSHEYIQSLNSLKNNLIHKLMKDNVAMTKARLHSRERALEAMEKEFNLHMTSDTESFDDSSMMLFSKLLQLKEQFISKLLVENIYTHPALYELQQFLSQLQ